MINSHPPLSSEKKKKIILFGIIPVCLLAMSVLIYLQIAGSSRRVKKTLPASTVPIPEKPRPDTLANNKSELYTILDGDQKKEDEGKAVFNANDKLNMDNNITQPAAKLTQENQPPTFVAPRSYHNYSTEYPVRHKNLTLTDGESNSSFNSIVVNHEDRKGPDYAQVQKTPAVDEVNCPAMVTAKTRIREGSSLTVQTLEDMIINGKSIPMGTAITGAARISGNRVSLRVSSMNLENKVVFVRLSAYDEDGMEGLKVQGNPGIRNGTRETMDEQINGVGQEAEAQISGLGGHLVDGLVRNITRTGNLRKDEVTIPAGYKLILKSN